MAKKLTCPEEIKNNLLDQLCASCSIDPEHRKNVYPVFFEGEYTPGYWDPEDPDWLDPGGTLDPEEGIEYEYPMQLFDEAGRQISLYKSMDVFIEILCMLRRYEKSLELVDFLNRYGRNITFRERNS